jgi:putative SOS response-associated peptidase YedK
LSSSTEGLFDRNQDGLDVGAGPGRPGQVIRLNRRTGKRHLDILTWGLLPYGTADPDTSPRPIHARAKTVAKRPMFASAFRKGRALVPVSGYFQRQTKGSSGPRHTIFRRDGQPMAVAGLWQSRVVPAGDIIRTYCVIAGDLALNQSARAAVSSPQRCRHRAFCAFRSNGRQG